jgi:RNA recognition motif-containing protein
LQVTNIRLPRDERKPKGFGYVEFGNRSSLISALTMVDTVCNSVPFNIDFSLLAGLRGDLIFFFFFPIPSSHVWFNCLSLVSIRWNSKYILPIAVVLFYILKNNDKKF